MNRCEFRWKKNENPDNWHLFVQQGTRRMRTPLSPTAIPPRLEALRHSDYARLLIDNLPYIENQCRRAVALRSERGGSLAGYRTMSLQECDLDADELFNDVLDRLVANDFKALKDFQGKAKLTTYISTVIANLVVDIVRSKKGRSRARERAREMGPVAEQLYELVMGRGYSLADAFAHLQLSCGYAGSLEALEEMLQRMRGREQQGVAADPQGWPAVGREVRTDAGTDLVVPDPAMNPEEALSERQRGSRVAGALEETLSALDGEERLLLRMRYPAGEDEQPLSVAVIAQRLGLTAKAVDNRLRRILQRCRETMLRRGVGIDDLDRR
jgi:RNA polymerase sigma factor (sigma-70 family)